MNDTTITRGVADALRPAAGDLLVTHEDYQIRWVPGRFEVSCDGWLLDHFSSYLRAIVFVGECAARDAERATAGAADD
jgi:hypothetical protein